MEGSPSLAFRVSTTLRDYTAFWKSTPTIAKAATPNDAKAVHAGHLFLLATASAATTNQPIPAMINHLRRVM